MPDFPLHNPHDHFFKTTFSRHENAVAFFRTFLPRDLSAQIDWKTLVQVPGTFLDEKLRERASDLLFGAQWQDAPVRLYCLFEHQSTPDVLMPLRLLGYMVRIWEDFIKTEGEGRAVKLPLIVPVVLYQGKEEWPGSRQFVNMVEVPLGANSGSWREFTPDFGHLRVDFCKEETAGLMQDLSLKVIAKLMRAVAGADGEGDLGEGLDAIREIAESSNDLAYVRACLSYLFNAADALDVEELLQHIEAIEDPRLKEDTMTIAERLIERGRKEGIEHGRKEGIHHGEIVILRRQLERRFGSLPGWAEEKLENATPLQLENWSETLLEASTLEAVFVE